MLVPLGSMWISPSNSQWEESKAIARATLEAEAEHLQSMSQLHWIKSREFCSAALLWPWGKRFVSDTPTDELFSFHGHIQFSLSVTSSPCELVSCPFAAASRGYLLLFGLKSNANGPLALFLCLCPPAPTDTKKRKSYIRVILYFQPNPLGHFSLF